ncbi:HAMP domain-containing protein, partial [bacterium]|nr:HAMP domain-containing protein [bacterium]
MKARLPHFANTLLFRISATFLLLLGVSLGGWYLWIESNVFNPYADEAEQNWYEDLAADELDALAARLAVPGLSPAERDEFLVAYGAAVAAYQAEVIVFDAEGNQLASSAPDSLAEAVPMVAADLLNDMSDGDWDYGSYPDPANLEAYVNRIFEVDRIMAGDDIAGYLVASYAPVDLLGDDLNQQMAMIHAQDRIVKALAALLIYSAVTALLIMAWTSARVGKLSDGVAAFAGGDLAHRVHVRSTDEIGQLGRNFNAMAA